MIYVLAAPAKDATSHIPTYKGDQWRHVSNGREKMLKANNDEASQPTGDTGGRDKGPASDCTPEVELRFELLFSAIYHDLCERRFGFAHRGLTALTLILGSSAAAAFTSEYGAWTPYLALLVAVVSAAQLVWDFGGLSKTHASLKGVYYGLLSDLARGGDEAEIRADMLVAYGKEPPMIRRLMLRADAQARESLYGPQG